MLFIYIYFLKNNLLKNYKIKTAKCKIAAVLLQGIKKKNSLFFRQKTWLANVRFTIALRETKDAKGTQGN